MLDTIPAAYLFILGAMIVVSIVGYIAIRK